jgi:predicted Zn-dependent protease
LLLDRASIHERSGDFGAAQATYREMLQRSPENPIALNNLAYLLARDPKRLDEALDLAERAHQRLPRSPAVADTLGWILYQRGSLERAEILLAEAARALPGSPQVQYHLGLTYAKRGKQGEARAALEAALPALTGDEASEARR